MTIGSSVWLGLMGAEIQTEDPFIYIYAGDRFDMWRWILCIITDKYSVLPHTRSWLMVSEFNSSISWNLSRFCQHLSSVSIVPTNIKSFVFNFPYPYSPSRSTWSLSNMLQHNCALICDDMADPDQTFASYCLGCLYLLCEVSRIDA